MLQASHENRVHLICNRNPTRLCDFFHPADDDTNEALLARLDNLMQAGPSPLVIHNPCIHTLEVYHGNAGIDTYPARLQEEDDFDAFAGADHQEQELYHAYDGYEDGEDGCTTLSGCTTLGGSEDAA